MFPKRMKHAIFDTRLIRSASSWLGTCLGILTLRLKLGSIAFMVFFEKNTLGLNLMLIVDGSPSLDTS
jgi:hypothetical protein